VLIIGVKFVVSMFYEGKYKTKKERVLRKGETMSRGAKKYKRKNTSG